MLPSGVVVAQNEFSGGSARVLVGGTWQELCAGPRAMAVDVVGRLIGTSAIGGLGVAGRIGAGTARRGLGEPPAAVRIGSTLRTRGNGLPATAIVLTVTGLTSFPQGAGPLTVLFPQAGVGCDALVAPDILGILFTTTGIAESELFLPNTLPLVGVSFFHQMVPIEVDAQVAWIAVTATNALQMTVGTY